MFRKNKRIKYYKYKMDSKCSAEHYGYCNGKVKEYSYHLHYKQVSKNVILCSEEDDHNIKVNMCAFHRAWVLSNNQGKEPETYGWNVEDALDGLFHCCNFKDKYTFWYCTVHDDGVLIKDQNTEEVPEWYCNSMCKTEPGVVLHRQCEQIDWYKTGVINYDGKMIAELEPIDRDRYSSTGNGGGFKFEHYSYEYLIKDGKSGKGKHFIFEENTPIKWWFQFKTKAL